MIVETEAFLRIVRGKLPEVGREHFFAAVETYAATDEVCQTLIYHVAEDILERGLIYLVSGRLAVEITDDNISEITRFELNGAMLSSGFKPDEVLTIKSSSWQYVMPFDLTNDIQSSAQDRLTDIDQPFAVCLKTRISQADRTRYIASAQRSVPLSRSSGPISYVIANDVLDQDLMLVIEIWGDSAAFQKHLKAEYHHRRVNDLLALDFSAEGGIRFSAISWEKCPL